MKADKVSGVKRNAEAIICFGLFGVLICVSLYFMKVEEKRAKIIGQVQTLFNRMSIKTREEFISRKQLEMDEQRIFLGSLVSRPVSYYGLIIRRNPFAPLLPFDPPEIEIVPTFLPGDLALTEAPVVSGDGKWIANIINQKTGESYSVREGEDIVETVSVVKIDRDKVIISVEGGSDITLKPQEVLPIPQGRVDLVFNGTIEIGGKLVAQVENTKTGEIYFKREGEMVGTNFKIEKIEVGRIILSREDGDNVELILGGGD